MKVKLDEGAKLPVRAHDTDAGYDIFVPTNSNAITVRPHQSAVIDTGVHIAIPKGYVGFLKAKSGLNVKFNLTGEGVIDSGYTGSIVVKMYNLGDHEYTFIGGDKLIQIVLLPIYTPELEIVKTLEETERGDKGFGSTGL